MTFTIDAARPEDAPGILALLDDNRLPIDGVADCLDSAFVVRDGDRVVGVTALEIYPDGGLLRSVAVDLGARGQGLGRRLTSAALDLARMLNLPAVYLLTTTAERFFPKLGFGEISRADVPPSVQQSIEFRSACPSSAIVMRILLADR
jgi:amino-acid N-acetyltransferase